MQEGLVDIKSQKSEELKAMNVEKQQLMRREEELLKEITEMEKHLLKQEEDHRKRMEDMAKANDMSQGNGQSNSKHVPAQALDLARDYGQKSASFAQTRAQLEKERKVSSTTRAPFLATPVVYRVAAVAGRSPCLK